MCAIRARILIPMLSTMTSSDALSEYLRHTGSALFAVPPGVKDENDYICSGLFQLVDVWD